MCEKRIRFALKCAHQQNEVSYKHVLTYLKLLIINRL